MGEPRGTDIIDFSRDDGHDNGREVDAETPVSAAALAFNNAALPPDMPEWLKDAIRADAAQIVQAMQEDDVRLTDAKSRQEDEQDNLDTMWQIVADRERREREWDQSRVAIGGVAMSGQEWDDAYEFLSDPKMRGKLINAMTRMKGWSQDRAERAADDALTLAQIAQRKKDGTITPADEAKAGAITRSNPDAVEMVKEAARLKSGRGYGADADASASTKALLSDDPTKATAEYQSVIRASTPSMKMDDSKTFASAPDLVARFDAVRDAAVLKPAAESIKPPSPQLVAQLDMNGPF